MLLVETTTACPNHCRDCPAGEGLTEPRQLSRARFQKVVDEIARSRDKPASIRFTGWGEALGWPHILPSIRQSVVAGVRTVGLISSGTFFDRISPCKLYDAGLTELEISVGAVSGKRSAEGRRRTINEALNGLEAAIRAKRPGVTLIVSMVDRWPQTDEAARFREHYSKMEGVDRVIVRQHARLADGEFEMSCKGERWPCPQLWQRLTLGASGKWRYCCSDWQEATSLPDPGLRIAWSQGVLCVYRALHERHAFDDVPGCRNCRIWCGSRWDEKSYAAQLRRKDQGFVGHTT